MDNDELLLAISNLVDAKLKPLKETIQDIKALQENEILPRLKKVEMAQENEVLPQLRDIQSCYVGTYKRYEKDAREIEGALVDVDLVKNVVQKHSGDLQEQRKRIQELDEKLQKLA